MPITYGKDKVGKYVRWGHQKKHHYTKSAAQARKAAGQDARRVYAAVAAKGGHIK